MPTPSHIVIGLGFGDESKGSIVDALVRKTGASTVVRFNGGAQAAHNVVAPDGWHHTFSQWGSGTLAGARTILTKDVVIDPLAMAQEAKHLGGIGIGEPFGLLTVDDRALVSTPFHAAMTKIRELARGSGRHGTCGVGVGETVMDSLNPAIDRDCLLRAGHLRRANACRWRLRMIRQDKLAGALQIVHRAKLITPEAAELMAILSSEAMEERCALEMTTVALRIRIAGWDEIAAMLREGNIVFEGAQGVLLDEWHGFHPHTTWSTTTGDNARAALISADMTSDVTTIGVTRSYATRHGAGPFPTELADQPIPGEHNGSEGIQGTFRVGWFDAVLAKYALDVDGRIDALAVTCLDQGRDQRNCIAYDSPVGRVTRLRAVPGNRDLDAREKLGEFLRTVTPVLMGRWRPEELAAELGKPLAVTSHGPTAADKKWMVA